MFVADNPAASSPSSAASASRKSPVGVRVAGARLRPRAPDAGGACAFLIERSDRTLWCFVSSHAALGWRLAFAPSSAGPFAAVALDAAGNTYPFSGSGGRWFLAAFPWAPTPWARLETSGATSAVTSCMVVGG
jgi:hypothetical protein